MTSDLPVTAPNRAPRANETSNYTEVNSKPVPWLQIHKADRIQTMGSSSPASD